MFKHCLSLGYSSIRFFEGTGNIRNFSSWRNLNLKRPWSGFKENFTSGNVSKGILAPTRQNIFKLFRNQSTNPLYVNTNVTNNVMLYRFEKPWMYKIAAGFAIFACVGCIAMADNVYLILCKNLFNTEIPLTDRLKDHFFPIAACLIGVLAGPLITFTVYYITIRTMKYIILRKGGETITFVTYHPFKMEKRMTVPLENVSCKTDRENKKGYLTLKIKNHRHHYMVDKGGHFVNPELFDSTVGIKRF